MPNFNWLDIVLGILLLVSTLDGLRKGFSREIIGLAASLLGLLLAFQFYRVAGGWLKTYITQDWLSSIAGFLVVFVGVLIAGSVLSSIVHRVLKSAGLSAVDRLLGGLYGFLRASLFGLAIVVGLITFTSAEAVVQSRIAPFLVETSGLVAKVAPRELASKFQRRYDEMKSSGKLPE